MLSDIDILSRREAGEIVIWPFQDDNMGTNSVDLTLGGMFYREQRPVVNGPIPLFRKGVTQTSPIGYFCNIYRQEDVDSMWGDPVEIPKGDFIILEPGENILAHTEEFIGGVVGNTTKMHARSSYGRCSITVCRCAGLGDEGYFTRWTMEVTNYSRFYHLPLMVGMRIAQLTFEDIGPTRKSYTVDRGSKYQEMTTNAVDLESALLELRMNWKPEMMKPRLPMDREFREGKYDPVEAELRSGLVLGPRKRSDSAT